MVSNETAPVPRTIIKFKGVNPALETEAHGRVLQWFFSYPAREVSLNDLCGLVGISKTTANGVVTLLQREGFLKIQPLGRLWRITCDQTHPYNITRKIPTHLAAIYESGMIDAIRTAIPGSRAIVLLGSYRRGDDTETSDVDIAVEVLGDREPETVLFGKIAQLGYRKDVAVNLLLFSRNRIDLNLFANIANGIVLDGFLEARP